MSAEIKHLITETDSGKTVENILRKKWGISSGLLSYLKTHKRILLNNSVCKTVDVCNVNDILVVDVSENLERICEITPWNKKIKILYEDDFILVVEKPGKMASHPCIGNFDNSLANAVVYHWSQNREYHHYHIVNRLDKDTSGICVIAKNRYAHGILAEQIKNNVFIRRYTALVHGIIKTDGSIELPIGRHPDSIIKHFVSPDGKFAKTNFYVKNVVKNCYTLLDICLETGRTHQIRVHFSHLGHPLVGDWLYGNGDDEKELIDRQALHAGYISFFHPLDKQLMTFETQLPEEIKKLLNVL